MDALQSVKKSADAVVASGLKNPYLMALIKVSLVLYAARIAPKLPAAFDQLFDNVIFKIVAVAAIAYIAEKDFQLAIMLAVVYVLSINYASGRGLLESFADFVREKATSGQTLIEPQTMLYPGCQNITLADLEAAFDGDKEKLAQTARYSFVELLKKAKGETKDVIMNIANAAGLPANRAFTEEDAPYIATLLIYAGFNISDSCRPPYN